MTNQKDTMPEHNLTPEEQTVFRKAQRKSVTVMKNVKYTDGSPSREIEEWPAPAPDVEGALEAFNWLLEYHLKPQPYQVKYNDKFCKQRNIVRAALQQQQDKDALIEKLVGALRRIVGTPGSSDHRAVAQEALAQYEKEGRGDDLQSR